MPLNVIALISGGKDSLYSLAHCVENGHNLSALANLYPKPDAAPEEILQQSRKDEDEDLNSFMYQTVGHTVIPLYSQALGLPLYRQQISGSAIQKGRYYDTSQDEGLLDETEDLIPLLKGILTEHPEANALSSGAILSTYQRTRVESVAIRLGLTPLSYLWQYPALPPPIGREESCTGLLDDMEAAGCDARIIKIASGGIKDALLWSNVTDPKTRNRILSGMMPFFQNHELWLRGAVVGEGGEYETLSLNGPSSIWKKRIVIHEVGTTTGEGGTSYASFSGAEVEDRNNQESESTDNLRVPGLLDKQFVSVRSEALNAEYRDPAYVTGNEISPLAINTVLPTVSSGLTSAYLTVNNLTSQQLPSPVSSNEPVQQLKAIIEQLPLVLSQISELLTTSSIVSSTLLLRSISDFAALNPVYANLWPAGLPNPPARVTIAAPLPANIHVALSLSLSLQPTELRRGLHVQSYSYWAPANIGPYSQAINVPLLPPTANDPSTNPHDASIPATIHLAGQIPLISASMQLLDSQNPFAEHAVLALQHLWRVGQERGVDLWPWGVAYLEGGHSDILERAETAMRVWQLAHQTPTHEPEPREEDGEEDAESTIDIWDLQNNRAYGRVGYGFGSQQFAATMTVGKHLHVLPNHSVFDTNGTGAGSQEQSMFIPPFVAAEVTSLPRNAAVEWWSMGLAGLVSSSTTGSKDKNVKVRSFECTGLPWRELSGVVIELSDESAEQDDDEDLENFRGLDIRGQQGADAKGNKLNRIVTFATLLLSKESTTSGTPEAVADIIDLIRSSSTAFDTLRPVKEHELVHGTLFLNFSASPEPSSSAQNAHLVSNPLFAAMTAIPCHRVWASSGWKSQAASLRGTAMSQGTIKEVRAVLLLRIDSQLA